MTIEQISRSTVKVVLSKNELKSYDLNFSMLDSDSVETKAMLLTLLQNIQQKVDIDLASDRLYIEAFAAKDGGCFLYISVIDDEDNSLSNNSKKDVFVALTAEFDNFNNLIILCRHLQKLSNDIVASQLYYHGLTMRLVLYADSNAECKICGLICEYGNFIGAGELYYSFTKEYFTCSEKYNAVSKLANLSTV